jgi:hypothetical protein
VLLQLRTDLVRDGLDPWDGWEVEVGAEGPGEGFGFDESFVEVPHEAVAYPVGVGLELDADGDERSGSFGLCR